jgi:hypothetical protein
VRWILAAALFVSACVAPTAERAGSEGLDLSGTWYVLVQARESGTSDLEAFEVEGAVWRFERFGGRLRWTLYASPIFDDEGGGVFSGSGPPTARQVEERTRGLVVSQRNAVEGTLVGSDAAGWSSEGNGRPLSATALSFTRQLRIADLAALPVFTIAETLGSAGAEDLGAWTRYEAFEVETDRLLGRYERQGERVGRFAMWRIAVRVQE